MYFIDAFCEEASVFFSSFVNCYRNCNCNIGAKVISVPDAMAVFNVALSLAHEMEIVRQSSALGQSLTVNAFKCMMLLLTTARGGRVVSASTSESVVHRFRDWRHHLVDA